MAAADVMERYVAAAQAGDFDTAFGEIWIFEGDQYAVDALLGG